MVVLFGWSYFFAPKKPAGDANANVAANTNTAPAHADASRRRRLSLNLKRRADHAGHDAESNRSRSTTPLYEVTLDSKGAVATSWVLLKNKSPKEERALYADGSNGTEKKPLQLISPEALNHNPREVPFRLSTDDRAVNAVVNDRNYAVAGADGDVTLTAGQEKKIDFTLTDASGVEVTKTFVFRADNYLSDLQVKLTKNGQTVPNTKLADRRQHWRPGHYHITVFITSNPRRSLTRTTRSIVKQGASLTFDANNQSSDAVPGNVDWAGVGDAYFAMAAVPSQQMQGLEYRASKYEFPTAPYYDGIISLGNPKQKHDRDAAPDHGICSDRRGRFGNQGLYRNKRLFCTVERSTERR